MAENELEDVFGEDLASQVRQKTAERRQERNRLTDQQLAKIAVEAVNNNKFKGGDPMFQYTTENNVSHTVLLMQVPELNNGTVWEYLSEPWEGAASLPLDYLGEWMRCTFPEKNDLKKIDAGDWVMVVGEIDEYEKDNGEIVESVYPVRGILTLDEVKEYAQQALQDEGFSPSEEEEEPEPEPEQEEEAEPEKEEEESPEPTEAEPVEESEPEEEPEEESSSDASSSKPDWMDDDESSSDSSSSSGSGLDGLMEESGATEEEESEEEEQPPVPYDDIANLVEELGDQEPKVWEVTEGDDRLDRLVEVVTTKLDLDNEEATREVIIEVIEEHNGDDEEEEEMDKLF